MRILSIFAFLVSFVSAPVFAANDVDGTARFTVLNYPTNAYWDYELENGELNGYLQGFGGDNGTVSLEKDDAGNWSGRIHRQTLSVHSVVETVEDDGDEVTEINLTLRPSGFYSFRIKREMEADEDGEYNISGSHSSGRAGPVMIRGFQDGPSLGGGNQFNDFNIRQGRDGGNYAGTTFVYDRFGRRTYSAFTELEAKDALDPQVLIQNDKVLYLVIYHLPYSLSAW